MSEDNKVAPQPEQPEQQPQTEQPQAQQLPEQPVQPQQAHQHQQPPVQQPQQTMPPQGVPHHQPYYPAAPAAPGKVRKDGGFGKFVQNKAVQLVGAGLIGIFIGGGAVATGVAVAGDGGPDRGDRSGFSGQWQVPDGGQGGGLQGGGPGGFGGNGPGSGY